MSPNAATTASAALTVNGPENTPSRRSATRSADVEQVMAPVDRSLERPLALHHRTGATGEQPEADVELAGDLLDRKVATTGRGQLDRQRNPIETNADPRHRTRRLVGEHEIGPSPSRPIDEQPRRVSVADRVHGLRQQRIGHAK